MWCDDVMSIRGRHQKKLVLSSSGFLTRREDSVSRKWSYARLNWYLIAAVITVHGLLSFLSDVYGLLALLWYISTRHATEPHLPQQSLPTLLLNFLYLTHDCLRRSFYVIYCPSFRCQSNSGPPFSSLAFSTLQCCPLLPLEHFLSWIFSKVRLVVKG